ncbi:hypothetical protein LCGC14_0484700, partial [marine sediment metagenome]
SIMLELHPSKIPEDLKKYFKPKRKYGPWILRNSIIWYKRNPIPNSAKDRFTTDFEYIFFFVKSRKYFFEQQLEPYAEATINDDRFGKTDLNITTIKEGYEEAGAQDPIEMKKRIFGKGLTLGRNKRCVWDVTTKSFPEAHFAVYPEKLIETPIKAGCPEFVCVKCGVPREKIMKPTEEYAKFLGKGYHEHNNDEQEGFGQPKKDGFKTMNAEYRMTGYTDCGCKVGFDGGVVLDPFFGSGTVGVVAMKNNRHFVGIELNPEYVVLVEKRLKPFLEQRKLPEVLEE